MLPSTSSCSCACSSTGPCSRSVLVMMMMMMMMMIVMLIHFFQQHGLWRDAETSNGKHHVSGPVSFSQLLDATR